MQRWPRRDYVHRADSLVVQCDAGADVCSVRATYDYKVAGRSGRRGQGYRGPGTLGGFRQRAALHPLREQRSAAAGRDRPRFRPAESGRRRGPGRDRRPSAQAPGPPGCRPPPRARSGRQARRSGQAPDGGRGCSNGDGEKGPRRRARPPRAASSRPAGPPRPRRGRHRRRRPAPTAPAALGRGRLLTGVGPGLPR